jgi:hypothetical protein
VQVTTSGEINWFPASDSGGMAIAYAGQLGYAVLRELKALGRQPHVQTGSAAPPIGLACRQSAAAMAPRTSPPAADTTLPAAGSVPVASSTVAEPSSGQQQQREQAFNIRNQSSTACYAISLLQAFAALPMLRDAVRQHAASAHAASAHAARDPHGKSCFARKQSLGCCVVCTLSTALESIVARKRVEAQAAVEDLLIAFTSHRHAWNAPLEQEDASELLIFFTHRIDAAMRKLIKLANRKLDEAAAEELQASGAAAPVDAAVPAAGGDASAPANAARAATDALETLTRKRAAARAEVLRSAEYRHLADINTLLYSTVQPVLCCLTCDHSHFAPGETQPVMHLSWQVKSGQQSMQGLIDQMLSQSSYVEVRCTSGVGSCKRAVRGSQQQASSRFELDDNGMMEEVKGTSPSLLPSAASPAAAGSVPAAPKLVLEAPLREHLKTHHVTVAPKVLVLIPLREHWHQQQGRVVNDQPVEVEEFINIPVTDQEQLSQSQHLSSMKPAVQVERYRCKAMVFMPPVEDMAQRDVAWNLGGRKRDAQHYAALRYDEAAKCWLHLDDQLACVQQLASFDQVKAKCLHSVRLAMYEHDPPLGGAAAPPVAEAQVQQQPLAADGDQAMAQMTDSWDGLLISPTQDGMQLAGADSRSVPTPDSEPDPALRPVQVGMPNASDRALQWRAKQAIVSSGATAQPLKPRVALIGAGAAALACAEILVRAGFEVHVYEARGRVGGRVYTRPFMESAMSMGATYAFAEKSELYGPAYNSSGLSLCAACEHRAIRQVGSQEAGMPRFIEVRDYQDSIEVRTRGKKKRRQPTNTTDVMWIAATAGGGHQSSVLATDYAVELGPLYDKVRSFSTTLRVAVANPLQQALFSSSWRVFASLFQVEHELLIAAKEAKRKRKVAGDQRVGVDHPAPSQSDALDAAIPKVLKQHTDPRFTSTLDKQRLAAMLRAEYVTRMGYNAAPSVLSLLDIADTDEQGWPKQGRMYWVDPGGVVSNRPHLGYELVLQPYMQALEKSAACHVHLRTVVFHISQEEVSHSNGKQTRRAVKFLTAPTQLSYNEDALMAEDLPPHPSTPMPQHFPQVVSDAEITRANKHPVEVDYLVCTVPMPVLAHQLPSVFDDMKSISAEHAAAVQRLGMEPGRELRCFLAFKHCLVHNAGEHLGTLSANVPALVRTAYHKRNGDADTEPWRFFVYPNTASCDPLTAPPFMQLLVAVMDPTRIVSAGALTWSVQRLADDALDHLRLLFTREEVERAVFLGALASHWLRDPFSRCSYVVIHDRTSVADVKQLEQAMGSIYFAGEAATTLQHLQQVYGAQLAGERAAQQIMSLHTHHVRMHACEAVIARAHVHLHLCGCAPCRRVCVQRASYGGGVGRHPAGASDDAAFQGGGVRLHQRPRAQSGTTTAAPLLRLAEQQHQRLGRGR